MTGLERANWRMLDAWQGGTINALALSPHFDINKVALAATAAGVFRSIDGGRTWQRSSSGLTDPHVLAVTFAPENRGEEQMVFAATNQGRLYASVDGGQSWREITSWAGLGRATALAIPPNFAADQTLFVATGEGVYRTQDGGNSWESSTFGLHDLEVLCLACDPDFAASEVLWAGTASGGFYRSRNGGRSWRDSGVGLPDDAITCLIISPLYRADRTLFVGTEGSGLFRSNDGGQTWAPVSAVLAQTGVFSLAANGDGHHLVVGTDVGVYVSFDQGQTWTPTHGEPFVATSLVYTPAGLVLAGAVDSGAYCSQDGGQNWRQTATGLIAHAPPVVVQSRRGEMFALDSLGLLAYSAAGATNWQTLAAVPAEAGVTAVAVSGNASNTQLWIATDDGACHRAIFHGAHPISWECCIRPEEDGPLFHSITPLADGHAATALLLAGDNGLVYRWTEVEGVQVISYSPPWSGETLLRLAVSPIDTAHPQLIAVTARLTASGHYHLQLWENQDGGAQWAHLAGLESEVPAVALAWPYDPVEQAIFFATRNRVIKLYRAGEQLDVSQAFLEEEIGITALVASPDFAVDHTLYAATNRGVYRSVDVGASWQSCGLGLAEQTIVGLFPAVDTGGLLAVELGGAIWLLAEESH